MTTPQELKIEKEIERVIREAMEKRKIKIEVSEVKKEVDNIHLFRDILGIRYISTREVLI